MEISQPQQKLSDDKRGALSHNRDSGDFLSCRKGFNKHSYSCRSPFLSVVGQNCPMTE